MKKQILFGVLLLLFCFACKQKTPQTLTEEEYGQLEKEADEYSNVVGYNLDSLIYKYKKAAADAITKKDSITFLRCYGRIVAELNENENIKDFEPYIPYLKSFLASKSIESVDIYKQIGSFHLSFGRKDSAIFYYNKGIDLAQKLSDSTQKFWALGQCLDEKAFCFGVISDYAKAISYSLSANYYYKQMPQNDTVFDIKGALCQNYQNLGRYYLKCGYEHEAYSYYHQACKDSPFYEKLAKYHLESQTPNIDSAYFYVQQLITICKEEENDKQLGRACKYLGEILFRQKKYKTAIDTLNLALELRKEDMAGMAATYKILSDVYLAQNQIHKAISCTQNGLHFVSNKEISASKITENPALNDILFPLEGLELFIQKVQILNEMQVGQALQIACITDTFIDNMRADLSAEGSKLVLSDKVTHFYHEAMEIALKMGNKEKAFYFAEKSKAFLLFSSLKDVEYKQVANIPIDTLEKEHALLQELSLWKAKEKVALNEKINIQKHILEITAKMEKLKQSLEQKYPQYYTLKYKTSPYTLAQIQQKITDNQAIIEYICGEKNWAWVITKEKSECIPLQNNISDSSIKVFAQQLANAKISPNLYNDFSFSLYQSFVKPIEEVSNTTNWVIIPDNALYYLPFDALQTTSSYDTLPYLLKKKNIAYHYSASLWAYLHKMKFSGESKDNYFVAAVDKFKDTRLRNFQKSKNLIQLFKDNLFQGKSLFPAQKKPFLNNFQSSKTQYPLVCIYTHSEADDYVSENSQIYFEDETLNLSEIFSLHIQAGLVILASCESGKGKLHKGEGMMSLARGFMYAGGQSILPTKWKVGEAQMNALLQFFIVELKAGKPKDVALRNAKLAFIRKSQGKTKPYDWAAPFLVGNTDAISFVNQHQTPNFADKWGKWGIIALAILGILAVAYKVGRLFMQNFLKSS